MKFGSLDGGEDVEDYGVSFVEISKIVAHKDASSEQNHLTEFGRQRSPPDDRRRNWDREGNWDETLQHGACLCTAFLP